MSLSIYDIYNQYLDQDKPTVDLITVDIDAQISSIVTANTEPIIIYDLTTLLNPLDILSRNRIIDQVIYYYRKLGIQAYVNNPQDENLGAETYATYSFLRNYNFETANWGSMIIRWNVRRSNEFMKAYC